MASLKDYRDLSIDWEMTPEEAVTLYLEWGNNWRKGERPPVRSKDDYSVYFVVNTWEGRPRLYLIRRNSEEARELLEIGLPGDLSDRFMRQVGGSKGVFPITPEIRTWLEREMGAENRTGV
ncbi:MAG: DVU0772 family protein [Desulfonatronovibrionaceae bacterium]